MNPEEQQTSVPNQGQGAPTPPPQKNTVMGVLSYLGPLVMVSYATASGDPFVKYHIKQGLVLLIIEAAAWLVGMMMWQLSPLVSLVDLGALVLSIIGIVNVVQGNQKELPLVGKFAAHIHI